MKRVLTIFFFIPFIMGLSSIKGESPKIKWVDFNTGLAQAQQTGKLAVIDCYTDWCGWCKVMDKKTFSDPKIIERINEKYIAIKFNPEKPGKYFAGSKDSLSGRQLLMALSNNKPSGYPTFFFFVPQDTKLFQLPGYQDANQFGATMNNIEKYQAQLITKD
ncbi:MAG: Thiol:disulfide interchange protein DsbD [Bacteroidia bacterium]|nr:MAG: Thiol:disulfide interchange protein DsbD [Bacteroidia bacterium]